MNVRDDFDMADIKQVSQDISLEGREKIMTLAERLLQEGMQKGILEGIQKGKLEGI
jgi:predicted transposase YdaD